MSARVYVSVLEGHASLSTGGSKREPGVTAAVHDRLYCHRDVAVFPSEEQYDRLGRSGMRAAAIRLAREACDRLNDAA